MEESQTNDNSDEVQSLSKGKANDFQFFCNMYLSLSTIDYFVLKPSSCFFANRQSIKAFTNRNKSPGTIWRGFDM